MFFFIALFIGGFLLSALLAPKPKIENARPSALSDFKFPRAKEGDPVPRGYGTYKTKGPNAITVTDFEARAIKKKQKTGLFSSKKVIVGYQYFIGLDLVAALGPCVTFRRMWLGKNEVWNACIAACTEVHIATIDLPELYGGKDRSGGVGGDVAFYSGNFDQAQDPYLIAQLGANVPAYVGIAHAVFRKFYWGNSTNVEAVSFELSHFSDSLTIGSSKHIMPNGLDANLVEVLYDLYVNDWGNLKVDPNIIDEDNWRAVAIIAYSEGNGGSFEIANPQQGADISREILRQLNGMIYQNPSSGLIELKLLRNDYDVEDLPTYGPSQIKVVRNYSKKLWEDTINTVRIKYQDRDKGYADDAIAVAADFANIRFQNRPRASEIGMPCVKTAALANAIAARELANLNVPLFQAELEFNRTAVPLAPGDVFKLQWPEYNIVSMVVRIRKFGLGNREDGKIIMSVVQDEFAIDATVYGVPEVPIDTGGDYSPSLIVDYKYFELPYFLATASEFATVEGYTHYAAFAAQPSTASLDYSMTIDDTDTTEILSNAPYTANAKLLSAVDRWADFDDGLMATLIIKEMSEPDILTDADLTAVRTGANLFYAGDELMAYETFTDNGDGTYTLENVHRSLIDTGWFEHPADEVIFFFDGQEGFSEDSTAVAPFTTYLQDRTFTGRWPADTAPTTDLVPVGRGLLPAPPDLATADGLRVVGEVYDVGDILAVTARPRNRLDASLAVENDAAGVAEGGTLYRIGYEIAGVEHVVADDQALPYNLTVVSGMIGNCVVLVWAKTTAGVSFSASPIPITVVNTATRVTEGSSYDRVTETGDVRAIEG